MSKSHNVKGVNVQNVDPMGGSVFWRLITVFVGSVFDDHSGMHETSF